MTANIIVTGTDTGVGKTIFAAALAGALHGSYWKPIQAGLQEETGLFPIVTGDRLFTGNAPGGSAECRN